MPKVTNKMILEKLLEIEREQKRTKLHFMNIGKQCFNCKYWTRENKTGDYGTCKYITEIYKNDTYITDWRHGCEHFDYMSELLGGINAKN